jgi:hypothetical protein
MRHTEKIITFNNRVARSVPHRFKLLTIFEVLSMPPPAWLVRDFVEQESYAVLFGPSGSGKSFVALDMALSIATGVPWAGHEVTRGPTVYVASEGQRGLVLRVQAWSQERGVEWGDLNDFRPMADSPQLRDPADVDALIASLAKLDPPPVLVVIDTLASSNVGGKENDSADVGLVNAAVGRIQRETGATVLLVHHTGKKDQAKERGSTALRGAADTMLQVTRRGHVVTVKSDKQRNSDDPPEASFGLRIVSFETAAGGEWRTSCVLVPRGAPEVPQLSKNDRRLLRALGKHPGGIARATDWQETTTGMSDGTFHNRRRYLVDQGLIEKLPTGGYRLSSKGATFLKPGIAPLFDGGASATGKVARLAPRRRANRARKMGSD